MTRATGPVVILHGAVPPTAPPDEQDVLVQVEQVAQALESLGYPVATLPLTLDLADARRQLEDLRPRLVFNLVESIAGSGRLSLLGPALLEELALPYTGASYTALFLTSHKLLAKQHLRAAGLPTPDWLPDATVKTKVTAEPWIVKSVWEDASFALDDNALVRSLSDVEAGLAERHRRLGGEWFAETFIDGREFNLSLLDYGGRMMALPPAEICFDAFPPDKTRIVGYKAKWEPDSFEYRHTVRRLSFPPSDRLLLQQLAMLAERCAELFQLRGYARVDFRVDSRRQPWILEINANPCLAPDAGFVAAARQAGMTFSDVIQRLVVAVPGWSHDA
ncbi:MAG: D-alanine--D-alanine ligase [Candidatus Competibacteraceae bacterium]